MKKQGLQPIRGFRDIYPSDMVLQYYLFGTMKKVADIMGFEPYDGPAIEPIELYLGKSSEELVNKQTFQIEGKKEDQKLVLRPEMTPSLARMIAARAGELTFPLKLFSLGLRFRYEAPQKGRSREFVQADFDILGSDSVLADAEILTAAVNILLAFGATEKDFKVYINSRRFMQEKLLEVGVREEELKETLSLIDKADKQDTNLPDSINRLIETKVKPEEDEYFKKLFVFLREFEIDKYCEINPAVVRGLDYYTGMVFEIKRPGEGRSTIIGGGRYDNLISDLDPKLNVPGVGFAVSDVILLEFMKDINKAPTLPTKQTRVLVTVFDKQTIGESIKVLNELRKNKIASEIYLNPDRKLDKQLKYADRNKIPYVVIVGPEEIKKNVVKLKDMNKQEQKELPLEDLCKSIQTS